MRYLPEDFDCHDWDIYGCPGEFVYGDDVYVPEEYMDELWKVIDGFPDYWISNYGRVYSSIRNKFLKPVLSKQGYYGVTLCNGRNHKNVRVNRLVAKAFKQNPNNLPIVMHLDNDRINNDMENLEWGTYEENNHWCSVCGRHGDGLTYEVRAMGNKARSTPVVAINLESGARYYFNSQHDAARALNVSQQHVWGVLNGYRKSTGGYTFEYLDKEIYQWAE